MVKRTTVLAADVTAVVAIGVPVVLARRHPSSTRVVTLELLPSSAPLSHTVMLVGWYSTCTAVSAHVMYDNHF